MSNLFISHSSHDAAAALELQARLAGQGHYSVFLDLDPHAGIQAGVSWERTLYTKLRACQAVVALCSDSYLASQWCFAEIALARMEGKEVFVLQIDPWSAQTRMPSILTEEQFIDLRAQREDGYLRLWNGFKVKGIIPAQAREWRPEESPYPGLRAFREEDGPIYFGRDAEIREAGELLNRVRRQGHPRLVMVLGSSGSGKSSLVRAGVVPLLRRDRAQWLVVKPFRPGPDPARELSAVLSLAFNDAGHPTDWQDIQRQLARGTADNATVDGAARMPAQGRPAPSPDARSARGQLLKALAAMEHELAAADSPVADALRRLMSHLAQPLDGPTADPPDPAKPAPADAPATMPSPTLIDLADRLRLYSGHTEASVVLVIDQFEELLGQAADHPASCFLALLREAIDAPASPLLVIGTMRSDYLGEFQRAAPLLGVEFKSQSIGPASRDGLRQIIEEPARLGQIQLEPGLADLLLQDTETADAMPLLAFTLRMLWERHHRQHAFEMAPYRALGGLQGAVAQAAEAAFEDAIHANPALEAEMRDAFLCMARPDAEGSGWRRQPVQWSLLSKSVQPAIASFIDPQRLLVKRSDGTVEVAHEALFRSWSRLKGWLADNMAALHLLRDIQIDAEKWQQTADADEKTAYLWRGARLARAVDLGQAGMLALSAVDRSFIDEAHRAEQGQREAAEARRKIELKRARVFAAVLGVMFLGAVGAALFGWRQWTRADAQSRLVLSRQLFAQAGDELAAGRLQRAYLLGAAGFNAAGTDAASSEQAAQSLRRIRAQPELLAFLSGHKRAVYGVALSPDGKTLASASADHAVILWDLASRLPIGSLTGHTDRVRSVTFSHDGKTVASASHDGTVRLWDVARRQPIGNPLKAHKGAVYAVVFTSDDGRTLASAGQDTTVMLWNLAQPDRPPVALPGHTDRVRGLAFSRNGATLASASEDKTVRLWAMPDGQALGPPLQGHESEVLGVAFSPDGRTLASAGFDQTVRLWDVASRQPKGTALTGHQSAVSGVAFSPDGRTVASSSEDRSVILWDAATGAAQGAPLIGHEFAVYGVAFSGDGTLLASASKDDNVILWNIANRKPPALVLSGHRDRVLAVAFHPNGKRLASASEDEAVLLWDLAGPAKLGAFKGHSGKVRGLAFNRDGTLLASASEDKTVMLWDVASQAPLPALQRADTEFDCVAFSPDGKTLAAAGNDRKVHLWDVATRVLIGELPEQHQNRIRSLAFNPDGSRLASAGQDGKVILWDIAGRRRAGPVLQGVRLRSVAFSPDGNTLAAASEDGSVRLWRAGTGEWLKDLLNGHQNIVYSVAFSPDSKTLAAASQDRVITLWDVVAGSPRGELLAGHKDQVQGVAFSPDGKTLATASDDKTVRLWGMDGGAVDARSPLDAVCGKANRNFTPDEWAVYIGTSMKYRALCPRLPSVTGGPPVTSQHTDRVQP